MIVIAEFFFLSLRVLFFTVIADLIRNLLPLVIADLIRNLAEGVFNRHYQCPSMSLRTHTADCAKTNVTVPYAPPRYARPRPPPKDNTMSVHIGDSH
jgi:hypothetical protein